MQKYQFRKEKKYDLFWDPDYKMKPPFMDGIPNLDTYCHIGSQRLHFILKNTAQTCIAYKVLQQEKKKEQKRKKMKLFPAFPITFPIF